MRIKKRVLVLENGTAEDITVSFLERLKTQLNIVFLELKSGHKLNVKADC